MRTTWVQRNLSPLATAVYRMAFVDRRAIAWGIKIIARHLNDRQKVSLKVALSRHQIIQPAFQSVRVDAYDHFQVSKIVTLKALLRAAEEFYQLSGRDDLRLILLQIANGKIQGDPVFQPHRTVDYRPVLETLKPRILRASGMEHRAWHDKLVEQAFEVAASKGTAIKRELLYRLRKTADIEGDIQCIVASLFMDVPARHLDGFFGRIREEELRNIKDSVIQIIRDFQELRDSFRFDAGQLAVDEKYIYRKMCELVKGAKTPQALLIFLLYKLIAARKARSSADSIFTEIRFIYAPLAERLGLIFLADDFRDQFLRLRDPAKRDEVKASAKRVIGMNYDEAKIFLACFVKDLMADLRARLAQTVPVMTVRYRVKSPYSLWNKVEVRNECPYDQLKDVLGVKIIVGTEKELKALCAALRKSVLFIVAPREIKAALQPSGPGLGWRGIKLAGRERGAVPIEIQLMTEEMNQANNCGKAATWHYNLEKELGETRQVFDRLEPEHVVTTNYDTNFYQLFNFWTVAPAEIA